MSTAELAQPETTVLACVRVPVRMIADVLPEEYRTNLERNQKIASCCRHPENHDIEAFKSHPRETRPDIYILHCNCGRKHRTFCVGEGDFRPVWGFVDTEALDDEPCHVFEAGSVSASLVDVTPVAELALKHDLF